MTFETRVPSIIGMQEYQKMHPRYLQMTLVLEEASCRFLEEQSAESFDLFCERVGQYLPHRDQHAHRRGLSVISVIRIDTYLRKLSDRVFQLESRLLRKRPHDGQDSEFEGFLKKRRVTYPDNSFLARVGDEAPALDDRMEVDR